MPKLRVAVVMGGRSSEHEISLASARSVLEALDPARYEAVTVEIGRDGRWELGSGMPAELERYGHSATETLPVPTSQVPATLSEVDVVFPVLHGPFGEDGTVQGLLELADVPYVGAGILASALCMDKDRFKAVLRDEGIPVTPSVTLRSRSGRLREPLRLPGVREARAARLLGRDQQGARRGRAPRRDRARLPARREGARRGIRLRGRGRVQRAREPGADRVDPGRDRGELRLVRLLRRSTTRAAWSS